MAIQTGFTWGSGNISEQSVFEGQDDMPGVVCYFLKDGEVFRKNAVIFGSGDEYCSQWNILSLAGISEEDWVPQYQYWKRPTEGKDNGTSTT